MNEYHMTGIVIEFMLIMCTYYCFKDIKEASPSGAAFRTLIGVVLFLASAYGAMLLFITLII
ncbi:hypothetical protein [Providencia huaxiensis]|uniref:hypothetical protein n=1 Tax=Providencia huaxiensis TaxID=2027290 RepID=UPI000E3B989F|nr:hypothetical protein DYB39_07090 [Providencia rettgeri]